MKTAIDAVNEFKGDLPSTPNFKNGGEEWLILLCKQEHRGYTQQWSGGSIYQGCSGFSDDHFEQISTYPEFLATVAECETNFGECKQSYSDYEFDYRLHLALKRNKPTKELDMDIDWSKVPPARATHYDVSPDVYPWIKEDDNGNKFWNHNQWVNYNCPISERDCHIRRPMLINCTSNNEPQPALIFTQEMYDNGVLPSVGMEVIFNAKVSHTSVFCDAVGRKVTVLLHHGGRALIHWAGHYETFTARAFKPLTPPVPLIDGKAYQFDMFNGNIPRKSVSGIYSADDDEFIYLQNVVRTGNCTNIQPLTVEVK